MSHDETVARIVSLLRDDDLPRPVFLLGAGASHSSGVPMAAELGRLIVKKHFAQRVRQPALDPKDLKDAEWQAWLRAQSWFDSSVANTTPTAASISDEELSGNFPIIVAECLRPERYRAESLTELLRPSRGLTPGYFCLAHLVTTAAISTVLTVNFDDCIPNSLNGIPHARRIREISGGSDAERLSPLSNLQLVWLHGRPEAFNSQNTPSQIQQIDANLKSEVLKIIKDRPLVVVGYRGAESSIMDDLLIGGAREAGNYKSGVYWCYLKNEPKDSKLETLEQLLGANFERLEIGGFDQLMEDLWWGWLAGFDRAGLWEDRVISRKELKLLCFNEVPWMWEWHPDFTRLSVNEHDGVLQITNTVAIWTHVKIVVDIPLTGDFEATIELKGTYVLELQATSLEDRNFNFNPRDRRSDFHQVDSKCMETLFIKRKGAELALARCSGRSKSTLRWIAWECESSVSFLLAISLHTSKDFSLGSCVLRLPRH